MRSGILRGRTWLVGTAALALFGGMALVNSPASAVPPNVSDLFELDGNPSAVSGTPDDWQDLLSSAGSAPGFVAKTSMPIVDSDSPTDKTYYTGGGSKDVRDVSDWQHSTGDVAPDKDEILNAFAAAYRTGTASDTNRDLIIYFGSDRFANNGDSQMGFWFFKNEISLNANGHFNGVHTAKAAATATTPAHGGDLLVLSDFSGGGSVSTINVYEWVGGKNPLVHIDAGAGSVDCDTSTHNVKVCAIENEAQADAVWTYVPKAGASGKYPIGSFLEGGLNVSALLPGTDQCFASFLAETRSSTSTTAQLKDFALGRFPICAPTTSLTASPVPDDTATTADESTVIHKGASQTFTFSEENDGDLPLTDPHMTTNNSSCSPALVSGNSDNDNPAVLDPDETFVYQCTLTNLQADTTIVGTGHGTDFRNKDVTKCTGSETAEQLANLVCDDDEQATASVKVINPRTTITVSTSPSPVHVGDEVTVAISETNNGTRALENIHGVTVSFDRCTPALSPASQATGSGVAADAELDFGETWTYSCKFNALATDDDDVDDDYAALADGLDVTGMHVTYCADTNAPPDNTYCSQNERATTSIRIINPSTILVATASALVTYQFVETNDGQTPLTSPTLSAPGCTSAITITNKGNNDAVLDAGESWTYTCTATVMGPTATDGVTVTGTGAGIDEANSNVTYCDSATVPAAPRVCDSDERDSVTVKIIHN